MTHIANQLLATNHEIKTLALLKKTDVRSIELWIMQQWLKENYEEEVKKYSFSNSQPSQHPEDFWGTTAETQQFFKLSTQDLFTLRQAKFLEEGVHYKRENNGGKSAPLLYNFYKSCLAIYGISYEQYTITNTSYNERHQSAKLASLDKAREKKQKGQETTARQLFKGGKKK